MRNTQTGALMRSIQGLPNSFYQVAEGGRLIYFSIAEEVFPAVHSMIQSQEYSLYYVLYIYKGDVLALESYSKVNMLLDALRHEEIIFLPRTVNSSRAEDDIREVIADAVQIAFCLKLTLSVCCIWLRSIMF